MREIKGKPIAMVAMEGSSAMVLLIGEGSPAATMVKEERNIRGTS